MAKKTRKRSESIRTRPPVGRILEIFNRIQKGRFPNSTSIARELEVSTRTILRDVEYMRNNLGLPIEYDAEKYGLYFSAPVASFPLLQISEGELVALFIAQKALLPYHGTAFEQPLRIAFEKLSGSLRGEVSVSWSDLDSEISFRNIEANPADLKVFQDVSAAVQRRVELEFEYCKAGSSTFQKRTVKPYHLACINNQWYLFGDDAMRRGLRTFVLPRMRRTRMTERRFPKPKNFSINEFLKGSFGVSRRVAGMK